MCTNTMGTQIKNGNTPGGNKRRQGKNRNNKPRGGPPIQRPRNHLGAFFGPPPPGRPFRNGRNGPLPPPPPHNQHGFMPPPLPPPPRALRGLPPPPCGGGIRRPPIRPLMQGPPPPPALCGGPARPLMPPPPPPPPHMIMPPPRFPMRPMLGPAFRGRRPPPPPLGGRIQRPQQQRLMQRKLAIRRTMANQKKETLAIGGTGETACTNGGGRDFTGAQEDCQDLEEDYDSNFEETDEDFYCTNYDCSHYDDSYNGTDEDEDILYAAESDEYYCEPCDSTFLTEELLVEHQNSDHQTCDIDGCTFSADEETVLVHQKYQHSNGLYARIRGTANSAENLRKWLDERKVKYPNRRNIERRYRQQEEMLKRGERVTFRQNHFDRDSTRLEVIKMTRKQQCPTTAKRNSQQNQAPEKKVSLIDVMADWNGTMFPFQGVSDIYGDTVNSIDWSDSSDDEEPTCNNHNCTAELKNSLGSLLTAYQSNSSSDENIDGSEENEPPIEQKILRTPLLPCPFRENDNNTVVAKQTELEAESSVAEEEEAVTKPKITKRTRLRKRKIRYECNKAVHVKKRRTSVVQQFRGTGLRFRKRRVTLLEKLLDTEIRHERNVLLQCVRYVVENNFFRA